MRRRVVCPRSHPASLYVRSLLSSFPVARCAFPGDTPDPGVALCSEPFELLPGGSLYLPGGRPPEPPTRLHPPPVALESQPFVPVQRRLRYGRPPAIRATRCG